MYTVYAHRNLSNGKSYVGMTSLEPKRRWDSGRGYQRNPKMWSDIRNSDWNKDWEHTILGKFEDKQEALNIEEMFIWLFDSINKGYNTSSYGSGNYERTEKTKKKLSESHTGKHLSEEHKKKISKSKTGEKNHMFGKHHSEETKSKMSEALTGEKNPMFGKHFSEESKRKISQSKGVNGILQYSKTGEFIAEYPSIGEAYRQTSYSQSSICKCCKGERKSAGGYIWKYKNI